MWLQFLIFLSLTLAGNSCTDEKQDLSEELVGEWRWIASVGGFAGLRITPETSQETQTLKFSKKGEYRTYKNDSLVAEGSYEIVRGKTIFSEDEKDLLVRPDRLKQVISITGDTLRLQDNLYDGFGHTYVRVEQ